MKRARTRGGRFLNSDAALTATEYAIVLTLIVLTAIGAGLLVGGKTEWMMGSLGSELSGVVGSHDGGSSSYTIANGQRLADRIRTDETEEKGLTFWKNPFAKDHDDAAKSR